MNLRVWSEFLTPEDLRHPRVAQLLTPFRCSVLIQVHPEGLTQNLAGALTALSQAGVPDIGLWLLLEPAAGYWPSERNAEAVLELARRIVSWQAPVNWLAIDLEPPLWQAKWSWLRRARENVNPARFAASAAIFGEIIDVAHQAGLGVLCAAHDYLAEDVWLGRPALQDLHEAPVLGLPWDVVSVMLYGSMLDVPPAATSRWLFETARLLAAHSIGASVGLTGVGVLGSEPHYRSPAALGRDAAVLKAAGVDDFAIYSLEGLLASAESAAWLRAVAEAEPVWPPASAWTRRERARRRILALAVAGWRGCRRG